MSFQQFRQIESRVAHEHLKVMRDRNLHFSAFRHHANILLHALAEEVAQRTNYNDGREVVLDFVLRAALAGQYPFIQQFPAARVGMLGLERQDHLDSIPLPYYKKVPIVPDAHYIVFDPMFATGGSKTQAIKFLVDAGISPSHITAVHVVSAPEAFGRLEQEPWGKEIAVYGVVIDRGLDKNNYIIGDGLGDFGDRYFGTDGGSGLISPA